MKNKEKTKGKKNGVECREVRDAASQQIKGKRENRNRTSGRHGLRVDGNFVFSGQAHH